MRIILVAHNVTYGNGQGRINLEIVRKALADGHEVRLIAADVDPEVIEMGASLRRVPVIRRPIILQITQFARRANRVLDDVLSEQSADAVVANGYTITRPHDLSLCQFVHSAWLRVDDGRDSRGPLNWAYQQFFTRFNVRQERISYSSARRVVVPSRKTAAELEAIGVSNAKVSVVPNGVDLQEFSPGLADRIALRLPSGMPILLFAGDLRTNRKGLRYVLQSLKQIPGVHLAIVGRSAGSPFVKYAEDLGVGHRVTFLDFRRDVANIMRACDLFVFPSRYDPFGLVVTEALACGLPVITSAATGASELMSERCGTVLSDPADVGTLTKAITDWVGRAGAAADDCRKAVVDHNWSNMASRYLDLLQASAPARR